MSCDSGVTSSSSEAESRPLRGYTPTEEALDESGSYLRNAFPISSPNLYPATNVLPRYSVQGRKAAAPPYLKYSATNQRA